MIKKFFAMLLCFGLVASMGTAIVGCNKEKTADEKAADKKKEDDKKKADEEAKKKP